MATVDAESLIPELAHQDLERFNTGLERSKTLVIELVRASRELRLGNDSSNVTLEQAAGMIEKNTKQMNLLSAATRGYQQEIEKTAKANAARGFKILRRPP